MYKYKEVPQTFEEAEKLLNDPAAVEDSKNGSKIPVITSILFTILKNFNPVARFTLAKLTGLDLSSHHDLYDYLRKTLKFEDNADIMEYSILAISTDESMKKTLQEVVSELQKAVKE